MELPSERNDASGLEEAVRLYELALHEALPSEPGCASGPVPGADEAKVRDMLVARDRVAHALKTDPVIDSETLCRITGLDRRLKSDLKTLVAMAPDTSFVNWREVVQPAASSWWWFLDERAAASEPRPINVSAVLAVLFLFITVCLIVDLTSQVFGNRWDFTAVFATVSPIVFALLGISTFTELGRQWIERIRFRTGFKLASVNAWRAALMLGLLAVAVLLKLTVPPVVAIVYNNRGFTFQQGGLHQRAIENFQQAILLNSTYVEPHYNLALAYEAAGQYDKALEEYQRVLTLNDRYYRAYNNLARLYILQRKDYAGALNQLNRALKLDPQEPEVKYSLYKNRGWANFEMQAYAQAESDLKVAIGLVPDPAKADFGAAAHCLLAMVRKGQKSPDRDSILKECEACVAYASSQTGRAEEVEATWLNSAHDCLREAEQK